MELGNNTISTPESKLSNEVEALCKTSRHLQFQFIWSDKLGVQNIRRSTSRYTSKEIFVTPVKQYELYISTYYELIYSKISLKLGVYKAYVDALKHDSYDMTRANPLMLLMVESLQIDCVMTVSKLVEGINRGERTFQKFLAFVESNINAIMVAYPQITNALVKTQRSQLEQIETQVKSILTQRDKYFAHADKKYFFEQCKIIEDFPNTYSELVDIERVLQMIIGKHQELMGCGYPICMAEFAYAFSYKTLNHIKAAEKEWHEKYRQGEKW